MQGSTIVWIIVAIVVVVVLIGLTRSMTRKRRVEAHRTEAAELRDQAAEQDRVLREREAHAAEAERRGESASSVREVRDEQLRRADARDPDVRTDEEGYRVDEEGNRVDDGRRLGDEPGRDAGGQ